MATQALITEYCDITPKMIPVKKHAAKGVIGLKSQETTFLPSTRSKGLSGCSRGDETKDQPKDWLQAENQQARKTMKPLLDAGFVKDLERFLSQWDVVQLRRKELLHKRWTERVWLPLQRRVEDQVSRCGPTEAKRRQSSYSQYIRHGNAKGFVFLETFDPTEYNPFLLNVPNTRYKTYGRKEQHRIAPSCKAGRKCTNKHKKQSAHDHPLTESVTPKTPPLASSHYPPSAAIKPPAEGKKSSRLCSIPYNALATATADGRCHKSSCWFSRCCSQQPPPGLERLQPSSTSK